MKYLFLCFIFLLWSNIINAQTTTVNGFVADTFYIQEAVINEDYYSEKLSTLAEKMKISSRSDISIEFFDSDISDTSNFQMSVYDIYTSLIIEYTLPKSRFRLIIKKGIPNNIIIFRESTTEERRGTNCGVPLMPKLKK